MGKKGKKTSAAGPLDPPSDLDEQGVIDSTPVNADEEVIEQEQNAANKKNKNASKGKKNKNKNDFDLEVDYETLLAADTENQTAKDDEKSQNGQKSNHKSKVNVPKMESDDENDDDEEGGGNNNNAAAAASRKNDDDGDEPQRVKSKKEKEKERKQRQKEAEKAKRAKQQQSQTKSIAASLTESAPNIDISSKETATAESKNETKKPANAKVNAIRELQLQRQREREERERAEAELRRQAEEQQRREEEEERKKAEAKALKKQREREKKEQLRKEGKLLSKAERERVARNQLALEHLKAAGALNIAATTAGTEAKNDGQEASKKPKRIVYDNKRKKQQKDVPKKMEEVVKKEEEEEKVAELTNAVANVSVESPQSDTAENWEDDVADDWENEAVDDEEAEEDEEEEDDSASTISSSSSSGSSEDAEEKRRREDRERRDQRMQEALAARNKEDLRSPICCILGHVDTGKTKLLDTIRQTNVQEGEAGGITQQIGATYMPIDAIEKKCAVIDKNNKLNFKVPGLLVIDTPGHESFTNLRSRGNNLCNIAVLVIDIMHGLEPQTIESINLLKSRKTPFIVALNKIDRLFGWRPQPKCSVRDAIAAQNRAVQSEFETRLQATKTALMEHGLNSEVYYKNSDFKKVVSLVPTSAITGEGVPDLLMLILGLTQKMMSENLMFVGEIEATVLEVKVVEGHGTTIDVILVNGVLREGDRIVVCGMNGAIATNVRALLTPQPMRELRIKSAYVHHKECKAALGVKISAPDLDKAIAGSRLLVVGPNDDEELLKEEIQQDLDKLLQAIDTEDRGVCVQASTLGSLEALLSFLKDMKIPVAGIAIGPIHRKDVLKAGTALEKANMREFATILAFDVKIDKDAQDFADEIGVKIFKADIIYHLFDQFTAYMKQITESRKKETAGSAVWPCVVKIVPGCVFNKTDPILIGVEVVEGVLRLGTPLCVPGRGAVVLGKATSIEHNHKQQETAKRGMQVALKIEAGSDGAKTFGRHFDERDSICSKITRESIEVLKSNFRDEVSKDEWLLIKKLKTTLGVI